MANAPASVAMALVVAAAIASSSLPAAHAGTSFISRTCRRIQDAALCVAVLSADPRSALADTVHSLADIALDIAGDFVLENSRLARFLEIRIPRIRKGGASSVCRAAYRDATMDYLVARRMFNEGDYAGASQRMVSAHDAGETCEEAFREISTKSPLTDENRQMTEHCAVTRGLIDLLASSYCRCACSCRNF